VSERWADDPLLESPAGAPSRFWLGFLCGAGTATMVAFVTLVCIGIYVAIEEEEDFELGYEFLRGADVPDEVRLFLRENAFVEDGEDVLYFFSSDETFQSGGNVLTDRGVFVYWDDEVECLRGDYADVASARVRWSSDPAEWYTEVSLTLADETELELWLDAEQGLDRELVAELERRCRAAPGSVFTGLEVLPSEETAEEAPAEDR
jgi:hypothetical protein